MSRFYGSGCTCNMTDRDNVATCKKTKTSTIVVQQESIYSP